MNDDGVLPPSPVPDVGRVTLPELFVVLSAGWHDFRAAPGYGLFFSAVYVLGGLLLVFLGAGTVAWTLAVSLGFPLIAPFAAVGLYEVSRRLEAGIALDRREILSVVINERHRQIPWMGAIIVIYFLFWTFLAHMVFALFMGPAALINISTSLETYMTWRGLAMIGAEMLIGGVLAFLLFSMTVVSLPLLLEKEIDFVTAMLLSFQVVRQNLLVMVIWAAIVSALTFLAMLPMFLGLFVVLPILGHATWHLYRRALCDPV